jgi:hypothetical protein
MSEHRIEYRALSALHRAPRNPQQHDLGALHQSFERFGYVEPIILSQASGRIVSGHGRLDALMQRRKEGRPAPDGITVDAAGEWLVPTIERPFLNPDEEAAYLIAANRLVTLGGQDDATLVAMLKDLAGGPGLPGTGYDNDDLDGLLKDLEKQGAPPVASAPPDATPGSECRIEIPCTKAQLNELFPILEEWRARGFTIHVQTS